MKNILFRLVSVTLIIFIIVQCFTQFAYAASNPKPMVKNITLFVGNETYKVKFNNLNNKAIVTYETSDKSIATISKDGMIKGISKGKTVIKVTIKQGKSTYKSNIYVTVSDPYISIENIPGSFEISETYSLIAKASGVKNPIFVWSSSDEAVASINKKTGEIIANASGVTKITLKDNTSGKSYSITICVNSPMNEGPYWGDVDHRYICFGNYPQSEITGDKLTESIINASYDTRGDTYINGIKYKRISNKNTTYVNTTADDYFYMHFDEVISYYNWSDGGYRYFKYEPIIWRVLENDNGELILLSEYCLDCQIIGESNDKISWENSSLRQWLNNDFINSAISKNNQQQIIKTKLTTAANAEYNTLKCSDTKDQVFILGIDDICNSTYGLDNSKNDFNSRSYCTTYAKAMGVGTVNDEGGSCFWWLRDKLDYGTDFLSIKYNGRTYYSCSSNVKIVGVRPAIKINKSLVAEYCYTKDELKNVAKNSPVWTDPTHKYIYFGGYPDSEVQKNDLNSEILNASYDSNGDAVINGVKYRRIDLSNDIFPWWQFSVYYYDWSEPGYRYFKYEPIKWRVLSNEKGELFLLSEKVIDCQAYNFIGYSIIEESFFNGVDNQDDIKIAWENCTLRSWLNTNFINSAFSQEAQSSIKTTIINNYGNNSYSTLSGINTEDKVIILSSNDVLNINYGFQKDCVWNRNKIKDEGCDQCRIAIASDYAWAMGSCRWTNGANSDDWWLRDNEGMTALVVGVRGTIDGNFAKYSFQGVRPAIIIDSNRICGN